MTNKEKLKSAIERDINSMNNYNEIIKKIEKGEKMKKNNIWKLCFVPALILFVAVVGICNNGIFTQKLDSVNSKKDKWIIKEVKTDKKNESETAEIPKWDEMPISQQFGEVDYNNGKYTSRISKISKEDVTKNIGNTTLTGYDTYTKTSYSKKGDLYSIKGINENSAIAVKFEGNSEYYVYVNSNYRPKTLGEFVEALNLKENISFGTIYYNYWDKGANENINVEFYNVDNEMIWQKLFSNLNLENVYSDNDKYISDNFSESIDISVNIPILGYEKISISLTDKGYLLTNILDTGKGFYIGKDKVQEFLDYIKKNYDGYKIVQIEESDNNMVNE